MKPAAQEGGYRQRRGRGHAEQKKHHRRGRPGGCRRRQALHRRLHGRRAGDRPDIKVNVNYTGNFGDTALAAEAANTHIKAGADVLTGSAQQVVGAIGVAKDNNVYWFGIQSDQARWRPRSW